MRSKKGQRAIRAIAALAAACAAYSMSASAQTIIHRTRVGQGAQCVTSLVEDGSGHLFRATGGAVIELTPPPNGGTNWTARTVALLPKNTGGVAQLALDAAGNLYCAVPVTPTDPWGYVFRLLRPTAGHHWQVEVLRSFGPKSLGSYPTSITVDPLGNVIGTTYEGGAERDYPYGVGVVFKLSPSADGRGPWPETVLHRFTEKEGNGFPDAPPILDSSGNIFGATNGFSFGQEGERLSLNYGTVYELSPQAGGGYGLTTLHTFKTEQDGVYPQDGLVRDQTGNIYGATFAGGTSNAGTVFKLSPPVTLGQNWRKTTLYSFGTGVSFPATGLTRTADGSLYGVAVSGGRGGAGGIYRLQPPARSGLPWSENDVVDFNTPATSKLGADVTEIPPVPISSAPSVSLLRSGGLATTTNFGLPKTVADFLIPKRFEQRANCSSPVRTPQ